VDAVLFEDGAHGVVAADLALVGGVLEVAQLDVFPDFLDGLGAGEGCFVEEGGEGGGEGHWFLGGLLEGGRGLGEGGGGLRRTWNPPFLLGLFFSPPLPLAMSLSSSSLTLFALFFLVFFLGSGARFFVFPPLVLRTRLFSSCCSLLAYAASSSSLGRVFFVFFLGGAASSRSESADSDAGERLAEEVEVPFSTVGMGSEGDGGLGLEALKASKRCMIRSVMASCGCY